MKLFSFLRFSFFAPLALAAVALSSPASAADIPQVGSSAPNFSLKTLDGKSVELNKLTAKHPVVLVVLRGWPGYQCPICARQVIEYVAKASEFSAQEAQVVMVYPGPSDQLQAHAQEFLSDKNWPASFLYVIDPDYTFTESYALRWNAKKETAYPSTFVIDREGKIRFAHTSKVHGDRVAAQTALDAVAALKK